MKNGPDRIKFWKQRGEPKKDAPPVTLKRAKLPLQFYMIQMKKVEIEVWGENRVQSQAATTVYLESYTRHLETIKYWFF